MKAFLTQDGNWIARCLVTGATASGASRVTAMFKLLKIIRGPST